MFLHFNLRHRDRRRDRWGRWGRWGRYRKREMPFSVWFYIIMLLQKWYFIIIKSNSSLLINHSWMNRPIDIGASRLIHVCRAHTFDLFLFVQFSPVCCNESCSFFAYTFGIIHNGKKCYICTTIIYMLHLDYR